MEKREFAKLNQEQMIIAFNDLKDDYRQLFAINADLEEEKQQLISWLEDKIKECMDKKEAFIEGLDNCDLEIDIMKVLNQRKVYQEVLDFVEKGGKDE